MRSERQFDGFTLLEMMVAMTLFTIVFLGIWETFSRASNAVSSSLAETDLDRALRKVSSRIVSELADSGFDDNGVNRVTSHPSDADTTEAFVTFARRVAVNGDANDWSGDITYQLAASPGETPGNGTDDDGDGLVDEQRIVRVEGGTTSIISDGVLVLTVTRRNGENRLSIDVQLGKNVDLHKDPLIRDAASTVTLRH